jgi:hypothetical protein
VPEGWAEAAVAERRRAREERIEKARVFTDELARGGELVAAVVYGSVARGDFNVWSDIDLLLMMRSVSALDRVPAGVQVVAWTPDEFVKAFHAGNPIAREALGVGVAVHGAEALRRLAHELL